MKEISLKCNLRFVAQWSEKGFLISWTLLNFLRIKSSTFNQGYGRSYHETTPRSRSRLSMRTWLHLSIYRARFERCYQEQQSRTSWTHFRSMKKRPLNFRLQFEDSWYEKVSRRSNDITRRISRKLSRYRALRG